MPKSRPPYPLEFRREAVGMVRSGRTVKDVAEALGVTEQSLRNWVKQDQLDRRERDLAAVQDAFSRRIVGWSMADHMRHELVVDALTMAISRRRPEPGLVHHSDQGSQYVSLGFGQACTKAGIARSMGSRGDCWDNAVAETFFATLKKELVYRRSWPTRQELTSEAFE